MSHVIAGLVTIGVGVLAACVAFLFYVAFTKILRSFEKADSALGSIAWTLLAVACGAMGLSAFVAAIAFVSTGLGMAFSFS